MEKGTQKFLSILLSISILFCFPIVSQAAVGDYEATFTGTYTAPSSLRNVHISGSDVSVSEWYGDRVNIGGNTYSVRQNQYGLNKDDNMIDLGLNTTHTVWLAQYGVASFKFTAEKDGIYSFSASENSKYAPYLESLNNVQYQNIFRPIISVADFQYGRVLSWRESCYGDDYYHSMYEEENPSVAFKLSAGESTYLLASCSTEADIVYDVIINEVPIESCPHRLKYIGYESNGCKGTETYVCQWCGKTEQEEYFDHDWDYTYTHEAENCKDTTTGTRTCCDCNTTETFSWENDGPHIEASRIVDCIEDGEIEYECTCSVCGDTYYVWEASPCYNEETEECVHSFGSSYDVPCGQEVTCSVCGYTGTGYHDWVETSYTKTPISDNGKCYTATETDTCTKCGKTDADTWTHHNGDWEYVQITPQHDNVCGTYNYQCTNCGAYEYDKPLTCHSYKDNYVQCGYEKTCRRCGDYREEFYHDFDNGKYIAPTCTQNGGTLYTCVDCGATAIENIVPATGHNFGNNSPTCLTCGVANPNYVAPTTPPTQPTTPPTQPTTPPAQPTAITPTVTDIIGGKKQFTVKWKKVKDAEGYQVQYSTNNKFKKSKTVTTKSVSAKTIKSLKENTIYYVRIRSFVTIDGKKIYSKWTSAKSVITAKPSNKTSISKAKAGKKAIKMTWKKSSDAKGYQVQYSTDKSFKKATKSLVIKNKKSTSINIKNLKSKKNYYVRVRSYKIVKVNKKSTKVYSSWSKVKVIKVK